MRHLATVRVRTTIGATAIVGLALALAAVAMLHVLRNDLTDSVAAAAHLRASDLASLLEDGTPPGAVVTEGEDGSVVEVLAPGGDLLAASPSAHGSHLFEPLPRTDDAEVVRSPPAEHARFLVVTEQVDGADGLTVVVARDLEPVDETVATVGGLLGASIPAVLLLVAATTWAVTRRALHPVEAIRAEVATIADAEPGRRVPVPRGRDEIARLAQTMNAMLERLAQARLRQQHFVSDASHELRSPIATIRHQLEVVLASPEATTLSELATDLLAEDLRMQQLVDDLLLLARSDEVAPTSHRPVDLDDVVLDEAARLRSTSPRTVDTSATSAGRVMGDPAQLRRVVRNLLDNAQRHARSTVSVSLTTTPTRVVLTVADDGEGVPPADRERIFRRFARLDGGRARDAGGSGLGLSIVAQLVEAHSATITISDRIGGGAEFTLTFPSA